MKNIALMLLVCSLNIASAQIADSLVIRQRIDSLIQVSRSLTANRDFDHALGVNAIEEQMALEWRGARSAEYGDCAFNRGRVNIFKGDYQEAEDWYLKAKDIRQEVLGVEHPDYAWSLNNLAILYKDVGHYEKAEPLYLQAKAIRGNVLGPDHPLYAASLNNLANFYMNSGNYEKAEPLYLEANGIRKKVLGKAHPDYAWSVDNLAILYWNMGDYKKAEPLFLEAKSIREVTLGKTHHEYASSLNNLAVLYKDMGSYDKAEPLYIEAIAIRETILGKAHPDYAFSLNNLALLYRELGNYEKAEPLYLEASEILLNILGDRHPDYAASLNNLASLYIGLGDLKQAESLNLQAKRIWGDIYGKGHPNYALSLSNLATLYKDIGDYDEAEKLFLEALAIRENVQGKSHPNFASSLFELAHLYARQSRHSDSEPLLEEAFQLSIRSLVNAMSFLSEKELGNYVATLKSEGHFLSAYLDARQARGTPLGVLPPLMYDHALIYKGFLLTAATSISAPSLASPESLEINNRLKGFRRRLAAEYTKPVAERKGVAELEEKANEAEKELARSVAGYAEALQQVKWQDVRSALTSEAIALELIHFPVNFPRGTDSVMYAALLLKPGDDQPLYIPLFEERELDHLLSVDKERKADYVNELYAWADRGMVKLGSAKKSLYELIWSKIEAAGLEGIKTVYYSPSGVLHRLNLGAIAVDEETILSDMYNLVAMNSTRQLAIPTTVTTKANDALLVGGVNFEMDSVQISLKEEPLLAIRSSAESWTESGTRGGSWSYLRWTEKEVERIVTSLTTAGFDAVQITGADATEEAIKSIGTRGPSPLILHIATHGFFFPDPEIAPSSRRGLGVGESVFKSSDNPMIRSGLILAGGNYAWQHGRPVSPDREDGILTAYEISQMNLANTELVVLSACETGLGDIQGNEGVYGLQRAFKIAGAKYLIMSLWQVPDRETMEFMTTFYRNWLEQGLTIPDAFRKTQREMRDRFINPYSWGAFVLLE